MDTGSMKWTRKPKEFVIEKDRICGTEQVKSALEYMPAARRSQALKQSFQIWL